jgi:hypothetical protein
MNNKEEAWDIAYPAIVFLLQARNLPPSGWETLQRAVDHASKEVVEKEELCKHNIPIDENCDECAKEMGLSRCEQCDEIAWDGRICHACGAKDI